MEHFAGLDVSVKETSICIVDGTGKIVREVKVASEPETLLAVLTNPTYRFKRIGLEAGPLSQWLFSALAEAGLPAICVETRHMQAVLKAQINKTDRNDARGIAQMMRAELYRPVHVKTLRSQKLRMLLTHRKLLQSKAIAIENDLRATLRNFGLKVGVVGTARFSLGGKLCLKQATNLLHEMCTFLRRLERATFNGRQNAPLDPLVKYPCPDFSGVMPKLAVSSEGQMHAVLEVLIEHEVHKFFCIIRAITIRRGGKPGNAVNDFLDLAFVERRGTLGFVFSSESRADCFQRQSAAMHTSGDAHQGGVALTFSDDCLCRSCSRSRCA